MAKAPLPLRSVSFVSFGVNPSWVFKGPIKCPLFYCRPIKVLAREQWLVKSEFDSLSFSATLNHSNDCAHCPSLLLHVDDRLHRNLHFAQSVFSSTALSIANIQRCI